MGETLIYLLLSVSLSTGRNVVTKKTATAAKDRAQFFLSQAMLFAAATVLLLVFAWKDLGIIAPITWGYGLIYGTLLILSQWMLTLAMGKGSTGICTVIYSLGFLLPTLSGVLFWNETFDLFDGAGALTAVAVILLTAKGRPQGKGQGESFVPAILVAMAASGGLGIMQKLQQSTPAAQQNGAFLLIAFSLAFLCSSLAFLLCGKKPVLHKGCSFYPALTGLLFGGANFCNTVLAGRMKSAVFFPLQNVSTILLSTVLGILLFREKLTGKTVLLLILGIGVVLLFSL